MSLDEQQIGDLVARVVGRLREKGVVASDSNTPTKPSKRFRPVPGRDRDHPILRKYSPALPALTDPKHPAANSQQPIANSRRSVISQHPPFNIHSQSSAAGVYDDVDSACQAATRAREELSRLGFQARFKLIDAFRKIALENIERWARDAVAETSMGRVEDKILKNRLVALRTPGPEMLQNPETFVGDNGATFIRLEPFGVIAAVTPCTNSTETVINNGISMLSAGNSVVFNPHPIARRVSADAVRTINQALAAAGGPQELLCCISEPSIETANALMRHALTNLVLVTGGGAVVDAAMKCGKRAICAGPGNPPAVVDESADLERAARTLVAGASLDNNVVCTDEKAILAVDSVATALKALMLKHGCVEVSGDDIEKLTRLVLHDRGAPGRAGAPNKKYVGKNASVILREIGIDADERVRLVLVDVDKDHPLVWTEQLMPVLPICRLPDADAAIAHAAATEAGRRHTASIHSQRLDRITRFCNTMSCSICVVNDANYAGLGQDGEGYTSFSIATPTGEGMTTARTFCRERRLAVCGGALKIGC